MWFCTCSCALGPRWRGHSHDLVTGPDSRVASHVGGMVGIPGEMARRPLPLHPFSRPPILSHTAGRAVGAVRSGAPDPFLRPKLPAQRLGGRAAGPAGWASLLPTHLECRPLSTLLGCGSPRPQAIPHLRGSLLPCVGDRPPAAVPGVCGGWQRPHTLAPYGSQTEEGLRPVQTHGPPRALSPAPASANEAGVQGPTCRLGGFIYPRTPAAQRLRLVLRVSGSELLSGFTE